MKSLINVVQGCVCCKSVTIFWLIIYGKTHWDPSSPLPCLSWLLNLVTLAEWAEHSFSLAKARDTVIVKEVLGVKY